MFELENIGLQMKMPTVLLQMFSVYYKTRILSSYGPFLCTGTIICLCKLAMLFYPSFLIIEATHQAFVHVMNKGYQS